MSTLKTRWIQALRSGDYEQTNGALRTEEGYCCLGVLCDIAEGAGSWVLDEQEIVGAIWWFESGGDKGDTYPPLALHHRVGLSFPQMDALAMANDNGASFEELADRIEQGNYD